MNNRWNYCTEQEGTNEMSYSDMLKRKYQVFISSTYKNLVEHRQKAILGITKAGHMPVALENFTPSSESKRQVFRQALQSCQFYVIILGACLGSRPDDDPEGRCYVEIELDLAKELGLEILPFVMDMKLVQEQRKTNEFQNSSELTLISKYDALRKRLTDGLEGPFYKIFETPKDIEEELYAFFSRDHKVPGYILEPREKSDTEILRIYARNQIIRDVVQRLVQFETIEQRLASEADKKLVLAKAFADLYGDHIQNKYERVFLESGSTITYVAKALAEHLPHQGHCSVLTEVITNNVFAYLHLWLCSGILCYPVPAGPPDNKYGATYGELTNRRREPDYSLSPLKSYDPEAPEIINHLCKEVFGNDNNKKTLILAAISSIQLTGEINAVTIDSDGKESKLESDNSISKQLTNCRGFHVGSYENRLFKRSYYLSNYPSIVFVHDDKIDSKIVVGKCHFLFDLEYQWDTFASAYPLSIWIACTQTSYRDILSKFKNNLSRDGKWKFRVYGEGNRFPVVIGHNEAFRNASKEIRIEQPSLSLD